MWKQGLLIIALMGAAAALWWEPFLAATGLAAACPVLVQKGAPAGTAAALLNKAGARWALPTYTRGELKQYLGEDGGTLLMGMNGDVFDVSAGRRFYGPGAGYSLFAGVDATRSLSMGSLEQKDLEPPLNTDVSSFTAIEWTTLLEQYDFYLTKYSRVGRLVEDDGTSPAMYTGVDGPVQAPLTKEHQPKAE